MSARLDRILVVVAVASGTGVLVGFLGSPRAAALSYLVAYAYVFTIALGMLVMLTIGHLSRSRWFVLVRRIAEAVVGTFPVLALLFVPVLLSLEPIYPWLRPSSLDVEARHAVEARGGFQTIPAFTFRAVVYLLLAILSAELLCYFSRRQDEDDPERATRAMRLASPVVLSVASVVITATAFDWLLSLEPGFYSDIFGVYVFAGGILGALACLVLAAVAARRQAVLPAEFGTRHFHALGTLVFGFVIFWMYIAFCQFLLGWIADLPHEARYYLRRVESGYRAYSIGIVVAHFALPFVFLLFRRVREHASALAAVCGALAIAHYADIHWLLTVAARPRGPELTLLDVLSVVAVTSTVALSALVRFRTVAAIPRHDPLYDESLAYGGVP